ncbi:hypothetical protein [Antiquaquibacter soli]|uniref:DUF4190 domain-containing protein n=1 Tax=Antiquaquibacter soli TaxID=3064523 RepID=A0ABT9BJJ4_9MICO|nr:hypothetical protein [Protaetiibacter sp. WY-16]MDO7881192.1 hypothetical protein [Protaetiibacter sp. WY-16]
MTQPIDPTRVRDQPSLRNSSGTIWLVVGGLLTVVSAILLSFLTTLDTALAITGLVVVLALSVAMVAVRVLVPEGRRRLALMAGCMIGIAAASLLFIGIIAATQWEALGR